MDIKSTEKKFNLPAYLNLPLFLYQDSRLDKPATLIASFFYSLHTAGKSIEASTDYLCQLACIKKRHLYNILNLLEGIHYIERSGKTNKRLIVWIFCPKSEVIVTDGTSAPQCTKLAHSSALNSCTPMHTNNKEDNKENTTTTQQQFSSKSSTQEASPVDLITIFQEELPDNPNASYSSYNGEIGVGVLKVMDRFKKEWFSIYKKPLSKDGWRKYLQQMKSDCEGFCFEIMPRIKRRNGIKNFLNWEILQNLRKGELS